MDAVGAGAGSVAGTETWWKPEPERKQIVSAMQFCKQTILQYINPSLPSPFHSSLSRRSTNVFISLDRTKKHSPGTVRAGYTMQQLNPGENSS